MTLNLKTFVVKRFSPIFTQTSCLRNVHSSSLRCSYKLAVKPPQEETIESGIDTVSKTLLVTEIIKGIFA